MTEQIDEVLLNKVDNKRFVLFPIIHNDVYKLYKKAVSNNKKGFNREINIILALSKLNLIEKNY